jgi:hypothetical protein
MTLAARIAYINSQTAAMLAELEGMKAANMERQRNDCANAYGEWEFGNLANRFGLTHNQVIDYLREP